MRNSFVRSAFVAGLLAFPMPAIMIAQQTADLRTGVERDARTVLQRPVTVTFKDVSLERAVKTIAEQARVRIQYQMDMVEQVTRPVSVKAENLPLGVVLNQVLAGTQLYAVPSAADVLTIRRVPDMRAEVVDGTITGRVTSAKTKQPIVGATITIEGANGVVTGNDGTFRVTVASGDHTVTIRAVGFVRQAKSVTVTESGSVSLDVVLEPSASVLDEVIVTGTVVATERKAIPNPITVITAEDIEKRGITRVEELLRGDVPGVLALDDGIAVYSGGNIGEDQLGGTVATRIYARGASGVSPLSGEGRTAPLKTFVDGVELLDPSYLGTLDPRMIERIEIVTGPQAATIYGSGAMGGVMQIITKKGSGGTVHDMTASLRYGMLQSNFSQSITPKHSHSLGVTGGAGPEFSYSGTLSYDYIGQWQPNLFNRRYGISGGLTSKLDRVTLSASLSTTGSANGTNGVMANSGYAFLKLASNVQSGEWAQENTAGMFTKRESRTSNQTLSLTVDHRITDWWQQGGTIGRSQNKFSLIPQAPVFYAPLDTLFKRSESNGSRMNWAYNSSLLGSTANIVSSLLTVGGSGTRAEQTSFTACTAEASSTTYEDCGNRSLRLRVPLQDHNWGGFAQWRVGFLDKVYVTAGLRGERARGYGKDRRVDWTPTNGVSYVQEVGDVTIKLMGSYGRATKAPPSDAHRDVVTCYTNRDPGCMLTQAANPRIGPEYSRGPQGGIEVYLGNRGSLSINHYSQRITDLLQNVRFDSNSYVFTNSTRERWQRVSKWINTASIRSFGWESAAMINLGSITANGTYSWTKSRVETFDRRDGSIYSGFFVPGGEFPGMPSHVGMIRLSYANRGMRISIDNSYIGKTLQTSVSDIGDDYAWTSLSYARLNMYNGRISKGLRNAYIVKKAYNKSNLVMAQRLNQSVDITVNVNNLGNSFAADGDSYNPSLGRQTLFGVSIRHSLGR